MPDKATQLFAAVLKKEKSWWYASREFYAYCAEHTRDELERKWENTWRKMAVDHFRNADTYPDCEEIIPRGHSQIARWKENVNSRRFTIMTKAKDALPNCRSRAKERKAIKRLGHCLKRDDGDKGENVTTIAEYEPEDKRIDKLLNGFSMLTTEGKSEFMSRAKKLI